MEKPKDDPEFWTDINTLRDPAYTEFDPDDLIGLHDILKETVDGLASVISVRDQAYRKAGQEPPPGVVISGDYQLAVLHVLRQVDRAVQEQAANAAKIAGHQGASYTKLGAAWGVTRQSARTKWPDAVPARGQQVHEPIPLAYAGGTAAIHHDPEADAWWYIANGADGRHEECEPVHTTSTDATAAATAFLIAHTKQDVASL